MAGKTVFKTDDALRHPPAIVVPLKAVGEFVGEARFEDEVDVVAETDGHLAAEVEVRREECLPVAVVHTESDASEGTDGEGARRVVAVGLGGEVRHPVEVEGGLAEAATVVGAREEGLHTDAPGGEGRIPLGVGDACDGKYKSCRCNSSFQPCDKNGTCSGTSCKDDRGTLYQDCECPAVGTNGWVADPSSCCGTYTTTCTNRPSGKRVYKCKTVSTPSCVCGLTHDTNNSQCVSGCTDSRYEYVGNIPANAICNDYTGGIMSPCGSSCRCQSGYWDYTSSCDTQNSNICGELGYTDKSCSDDWIACPFDSSAKKCLN